MKKYYGLYYDFIFKTRVELYDNLTEFAERLAQFAEFEGSDMEVSVKVATFITERQEEAQEALLKLAKGLK
jgi:hypothetical protein